MKRRGTILVVDDDQAVRKALQRSLEHEGYSVHAEPGAEEGLAWLKANEAQMVISDYSMPKMTGLDFLSLVRDRHPDTCRVILTANADMEMAIRAINEGAVYRFLVKPWHDLELKVFLHIAFEHLELEAENRKLVARLRRHTDVFRALEREHPGILKVAQTEDGAVLVTEEELKELGM